MRAEKLCEPRFHDSAVSRDETRNLVEHHWLSLLPPEQRPGLDVSRDDSEAEQWNALVAADLSLDDGLTGSGRGSRVIGRSLPQGSRLRCCLPSTGPVAPTGVGAAGRAPRHPEA